MKLPIKVTDILSLLLLLLICSFLITSSFGMTGEEFNALEKSDKKILLEKAVRSYLDRIGNLSAAYTTNTFLCKSRNYEIISKEPPFTKDRFEYRRIGKSFWFHHWWWAGKNGVFPEMATTESFESFDAKEGVLRTLSTAGYLKEGELHAFITTDPSPACERALLPELFDVTCRCDSWTALGHFLDHADSWSFVDSEQKNLIQVELKDYHCQIPNESSGVRKMWFDPERGFLLVKQQRDYSVANQHWWNIAKIKDYELVNDTLVPSRVITYGIIPGSDTDCAAEEYILEEAHTGNVRNADITVEFPKGAIVVDKIRGIQYIEGEYIPGTPSPGAIVLRYTLVVIGSIFILLGVLRKYYEAKRK